MRSNALVPLRTDDLELWLTPDAGGSILRFDHVSAAGERIPILRGSDAVDAGPLDCGSFPLVPYCNRIRGGSFRFRGRDVAIAPNMAGDPSPLHGAGWLGRWQVEHADDQAAELRFRHQPGEWPWAYDARQSFRLDERGLDLILACRNLSDEPMPCGLGQHPYFPCTAETELDTKVTHAWTIDEQVLPVARVEAVGRYDLRARRICGQDLDNGFAGWSGEARIRTPGTGFGIRLASPDARFFQVYSPASGGLFVAEPVSHANAALNAPEESWPELGMDILEPGEEKRLRMRLELI